MSRHFNLMVALVAVLVALVQSGPIGEKLATCCKSVNRQVISDDITGYMIQKPAGSCVPAVIFQTARGLFCSQLTAHWVRRKIQAFERAKVRASAGPLLTASRLSSSSSSFSSSSSPSTSSSSPSTSSSSPSTSSSSPSSPSWPSSSSSFTPTTSLPSSPLPS